MSTLTVICGHCGSERAIAAPAPMAKQPLVCEACGHSAPYAAWIAATERELTAQANARMQGVSRARR